MDFFTTNLYTIILFPLWVFLIISLGKLVNVVVTRKIAVFMTLASTLYGLIFALGNLLNMAHNPNFVYENSFNFLRINDYNLNLGVYLDNLALIMLLLVTIISFVVQLYSSIYMKQDKSFARFFAYLNLFNFSMIGLVLSPNLFQNYVFWELVGVSSYLLIGFWYKKPSASNAAKKAFLMNRIGDCGLLAGTIIISYFMYQYSGVGDLATLPFDNLNDIGNYLYSYTNDFIFAIICLFLVVGSLAKSAQFPLHTWLADAMEGPTPVSALIHSATMVAAGVYLIARLYPIYNLSTPIMNFIAIIGLFTALICAYFAITQNDFKRILAYSTSSQLGLMFLALGAGAFTGGLFHLVTHAFFKSMLFLCSGIVIHSLSEQQDIRFMGGLRKHLPITAICYLIGCISASGLLFSGFSSKEMILGSLVTSHQFALAAGFLIVALMTAFYMFRSYFVVFEGEFKGSKKPLDSHKILDISVGILTVFTVFLGFASTSFSKFLQFQNNIPQTSEAFNPVLISISICLIGLLAAFIIYAKAKSRVKIPVLYQLSYNRFYIDNLYDFFSKKLYDAVTRIFSIFDRYVIDGIVNFTALNARAASWIFSKMQTGNFQSYLAYSVIFLAAIFTALMFSYSIIVNFSLISSGGG